MQNEETTIPVKKEKNGSASCTVSFSTEQVQESEKRSIAKLGQSVKIDGFRPGKAPLEKIREKINPEKLMDETIRNLLPEILEKVIKENNLHPIIPPKVDIESTKPMKLKIYFFEKPEVKIKNGNKIAIKSEPETVDEKDVDRLIHYILQQHQKSIEKEEPAENGDRITMNFTGSTLDEKEVPELNTVGHQAVIGSKTLLPGFEEELIGLKKGDEKRFTLTFPEKHQKEALRGKPVAFHVNITKVEKLHVPELTDEFVKTNMQTDTVEKFKEDVRASMLEQQKNANRKKEEEKALDEILKATQVDLAPELIDDELKSLMEDLQKHLLRENMSFADWIKQTQKSEEEAIKELQNQAEKRITLRFGLAQLVGERNVEVSEEEMEKHIAELLSHLSEEEKKKIGNAYKKGHHAYEQFKWQKKVEKLLDEIIN